jgi:SagB-type dehydrogenase family enzyme
MDGNRTVAEIAHALPDVPSQQLGDALSSLTRWGLVEEGTESNDTDGYNPETQCFFRRYAGGASAGRSGDELFHRILTTEVVLVGSNRHRDAIAYLESLLVSTGFPVVRYLSWDTMPALRLGAMSELFPVALSLDGEDYEELAKLDDFCSAAGVHWLRVALDHAKHVADIGPVFRRKESPCYRCFSQGQGGTGNRQARNNFDVKSDQVKFWMCMASTEIAYLVSGIGGSRLGGWFRRYSLEDWGSATLCFSAIPGCSDCRPIPDSGKDSPSGLRGRIDTASVFEDYVSNGSASSAPGTVIVDPRSLLELTKQTKRLSNCHQQSLPVNLPELSTPVLDLPFRAAANGQLLGVTEIGSLLMLAAGVRRIRHNTGALKRWAATAGNLGSVEVFLAVRRVNGLVPGYYFYQPQDHALAAFRRHTGTLCVDDFMSRVAGCDVADLPDAMVLFTAAYHRVASKYGPFGYRLINFDAGVALSQLRMVAACMNVSADIANRWADDLIEDQLPLDSFAEQPTAVVSLRGKQPGRSPMAPSPFESRPGIPASSREAHEFCDATGRQVVQMLYRDSRMRESEIQFAPFPIPPELQPAEHAVLKGKELPTPIHGGLSLGNILRQRSSVRRFTRDPVSIERLSTMLSFAQRADLDEWPGEHHGNGLNFLVLAQRVRELDAGVYEYEAAQTLLSVRGALAPDEISQLYVQDEFALAPLAIWITGSLAAACARHGAFGHRQLMLRAGAAGNRLWMAALGLGLTGTLVAGIVSRHARKILGLDGYLKSGLLAVAVGDAVQTTSIRRSSEFDGQ